MKNMRGNDKQNMYITMLDLYNEPLQMGQHDLIKHGGYKKENIQRNINFCIDSRELKKSNIFFCLKGKKTDGHNFVNKTL